MADSAPAYVSVLCTKDGSSHRVLVSHARVCGTIANMLDDCDDGGGDADAQAIPVPNVAADIMERVIAFCAKYPDAPTDPSEEQQLEMRTRPIEGWDREFVDVPLATLFDMILAANFLDCKAMLDVTCKAVAEMIKGKTPEQIQRVFGVEGEFTPEEMEQVRRDNPWLDEESAYQAKEDYMREREPEQ
tara:strand:- start:2174 stop:2737 length:564 start_codon:yes stop_codon:yes gene_type:complete